MDSMAYLASDILAALVLALLLWAVGRKTSRGMEDQRLFCGMLVANILLLVFDCATRLVNGQQFPGAVFLVYLTNLLCYLLNPLVSFYYARYCELKLGLPEETRRRHLALYGVIVVLHTVLALLSLWRPTVFGVAEGRYVRGPLFLLSFFLSALPAFIAFGEALWQRLHTAGGARRVENVLMLYLAPPVAGAALQLLWADSMVVWVSTMLSMLILFINLQNSQITTDALTGLNNRGRLHTYLDWKVRHLTEGQRLYLLMLDIDHFKQVNDRFGHMVGDQALHAAVNCLRSAARGSDFLARYGGDEFVVLAERATEQEIDALMERIEEATQAFNAAENAPYTLCFSMGCARWEPELPDTDTFIARADRNMYLQKNGVGIPQGQLSL